MFKVSNCRFENCIKSTSIGFDIIGTKMYDAFVLSFYTIIKKISIPK